MRTERLRLRRFTAADLDLLVALDGDPDVMRYLGNGRPLPPDEVAAHELPRMLADHGPLGYWAAFAEETFVGWFGAVPRDGDRASVELGYRLTRTAWGHGYATEGARCLVSLVFECGADRVVATTMAINSGSRRVLEKAGLRHVRTWFGEWDEPIPGAEHGDVDYELHRPVLAP